MTSFGWKNKRKMLCGGAATAFSSNDSSPTGDVDGIDPSSCSSAKKKQNTLDDPVCKTKDLTEAGAILAEEERYWEAINKWDKALEVTPGDERILEMKAQALMALNELLPAIETARLAVKCNPLWWIAWQTLGRALLNLGELCAASITFQKAIHLRPDCEELWTEDLEWTSQLRKAHKI